MKHMLMDSTLVSLRLHALEALGSNVNTVEMDTENLELVIAELQQHRSDARARGALPMFVPGQPSEGEMVKALDELSVFVSADPDDKHLRDAEETLRGVLREVLHLRRHVTHVQGVARVERDRRMDAESKIATLTAEKEALMAAVVKLHMEGRTSPDVAVITRTPLNAPPIEDRSERWREAGARIEAAEAAGRDPNPLDLNIVLEEHLKHAGFDPES